jgi:hypothetical protein
MGQEAGTAKAPDPPEERLTLAPPGGAGPLRVNVTIEGCPDCTVDGLMEMPLSEIEIAAGLIVTLADWLEPPYPALTVTDVEEVTVPAVTVKLPLLCPAAIV